MIEELDYFDDVTDDQEKKPVRNELRRTVMVEPRFRISSLRGQKKANIKEADGTGAAFSFDELYALDGRPKASSFNNLPRSRVWGTSFARRDTDASKDPRGTSFSSTSLDPRTLTNYDR